MGAQQSTLRSTLVMDHGTPVQAVVALPGGGLLVEYEIAVCGAYKVHVRGGKREIADVLEESRERHNQPVVTLRVERHAMAAAADAQVAAAPAEVASAAVATAAEAPAAAATAVAAAEVEAAAATEAAAVAEQAPTLASAADPLAQAPTATEAPTHSPPATDHPAMVMAAPSRSPPASTPLVQAQQAQLATSSERPIPQR